MASRFGIALVLALVTSATSLTAWAQTASDRETARALMDEGMARREKNDHEGALKRFEAADALMRVPTTGLEVARERVALGRLIEAREVLGNVLHHAPKAGEPAPFTEARERAAKLDEDLSARIPSVKIVLRGVEGSASVTVDGVDVPAASLIAPRKLNPGSHTVEARAGGRERHEQISIRERESRELVIDLSAPAPAPTPTPSTEPETGDQAPSKVPRILMYTGVGIALVGVAVGTIAGISSISAATSAKRGCTNNQCPPETYSDIDSAKTAGNISTAAFIVAGGGAALAIVGFLTTKSGDKTESAGVRPWIGAGAAGLRGRF